MYFIVDLEATCWEIPKTPDLNEIIDIGIVVCDDQYSIIDSWTSFVRPKFNLKLSSFCKKLTSIKQIEVDEAPSISEVICSFNDWFTVKFKTNPKDISWLTWDNWDLKCLISDCLRNQIDFPFSSHYDLKYIYSIIRKCKKSDKLGLREVLDRENIICPDNLHRGLVDAIVAAKIAKSIYPFELDQIALQDPLES